jgi:hypothetical protein
MVVLEIDLDKSFPVVITFMDFNVIENIAFKLEVIGYAKLGEVSAHIARALKQ